MDDHPNLLGFEVYACGTPLMVEAARADFIQKCHLKETDFYADSFLSLADKDRLAHDHPV
jgi:CDP-4-dehydro-6-deoxyglucose reductase